MVKPKKEVKREWPPPPEYKAKALELKAADEPDEEFPGMAELLRRSYNDVPLMTDAAADAWSAAEHRHELRRQARELLETARRLGAVIDLDADDAAGPSTNPKGKAPKEPKPDPKDSDDGGDYSQSIYRSLGLGGGY